MKKKVTKLFLSLSILFLNVYGITPVHIGKINIDTSSYDKFWPDYPTFILGPFTNTAFTSPGDGTMIMQAYIKKNSNQVDLYSVRGKTGSVIIPIIHDNIYIQRVSFSCYMLDDDNGWETIVNWRNEDGKDFCNVYDEDGTEILSDTGYAYYSSDINCTYIIITKSGAVDFSNYDIWQFRTNISTSTPKFLSKTKAAQLSLMQIYGLSDGNYKVSLVPSSGNQVQFQMFDLMGRCVFSKQLENLKAPVTFTIPESNVPNSPFIAKVKDGNETLYKKQIPVK